MDFSWSPEQQARIDDVVRFGSEQLADDVERRDAEGIFWHEGWRRCGRFGLLGLPSPAEYGGAGADRLTVMATLEALGYACRDNGLLFGINAHLWGCVLPVREFGSDAQRARWLPGLSDGSLIGALAMTEPGSGSDAYRLSTTAVAKEGGYLLNGVKTMVTNAPIADLIVVIAQTDPAGGIGGLSAFLVDRHTAGLQVSEPVAKMGLRTVPMGELTLTDCWVPADALLGHLGAGMAVFNLAMDWERACIMASAVGVMRHLLERSTAYAREHERFGQPIGGFQAVAHRLVDMKLRLETSRLLLYQLGWQRDGGRQSPGEPALVKLHLSESLVQSSLDALQIHGGNGYLAASGLERQVRDALAGRFYSGTSDVLRNIVARSLGL
ncbi:acyl-CoA dehydrogenase family protein [Streptomyces olivaceoviridis]|uniref:acyl-CoA dehydrogenase family protein n=1 Tax=Streptomyces olivaceoviridis TaxID=1921 RepID=UPI0036822656